MRDRTVIATRPPKVEVLRPTTIVRDPVIERVSRMMDDAFRIGPLRFGLDGILGLIPGVGDAVSGMVSVFIVWRAAQAGVPRAAIARMLTNVAVDSMLGAVPFVGDVFDFVFKANTKNLKIYEDSLNGRHQPGKDWTYVVIAVAAVLGILLVPLILLYLLLQPLLG